MIFVKHIIRNTLLYTLGLQGLDSQTPKHSAERIAGSRLTTALWQNGFPH